MTDQAPDIMIEVTGPEEKRGYRQLAVLLILTVVFTFVGLLWRTEVGCFVFLSLTLLITLFRSPPRLRRLLMVTWMILAIALVVGIFLYRWLKTPGMTTTIVDNAVLRFLIGTAWSQVFWSAVAGLLVGISLVWGPLLIVMYVSSEWLLAMRETYGVTRWQALRLLISMVLNWNYPYYLIEDGKMTLVKPAGVLDLLGGPGVAVVKPYNAVVFERAGEITRIEGPDMFMTKLFEFAKHIIDLRPQWESFPVEEVLTKDKVPLHIECGLGYRIESREQTAERGEDPREGVEGRRFPGIISGEYPVYKRTIFKAAYGPAGDWKFTTKGATITKLREVVSEFELQDVYRRDEQGREFILAEIGRRTKEKVAEIAHYWGVRVSTVNIDTIEVSETVRESEAVREQVWKMWGAEYARRRALIEAEGKREIVVTEAEAEAEKAQTKARADRDAAVFKAEALAIEARGKREAAIEEGRGKAAAKAEAFVQMVDALRRGGLTDEQITAILLQVCQVAGYEEYLRSMDMISPLIPGISRFMLPGVEGPEKGPAE